MQTKLNLVMDKIQPTFAKIEQLPLETFIAQLTVQIWRRFIGRSPINVGNLQSRAKVLAYDAGVLGEELFRTLCKLDDFHGDDIRTLRKQKVLELKEGMRKTDVVRSSALKYLQFLETISKRHIPGFEARAALRKSSRTEAAAAKVRKEKEEKEAAERKEKEAKAATARSVSVQTAESNAREQREMGTPVSVSRWRPNISQKEYQEGVRVFVELPGLSSDDLAIETNHRTLTIKGTKQGACFLENLSISHKFDLDQTRVEFDNGVLSITLPFTRVHLRERCHGHSRFSYL